jgi:zinc transporter 9
MRGAREAARVSGAFAASARARLGTARLAGVTSALTSALALDDTRRALSTRCGLDRRAGGTPAWNETPAWNATPSVFPELRSDRAWLSSPRRYRSTPSFGFAAAKLPASAKLRERSEKTTARAPIGEAVSTADDDDYGDDRDIVGGVGGSRKSDLDRESDARALNAVNVAVKANALIFLTKLGAFAITGSSVMFAEAVHSAADILNQSLLLLGIRSSFKAPDAKYNYGYRRERFVWSLISAVGVFFAGSGVSVAHGAHALFDPPPELEHVWVGVSVLAMSAVVDSYSLRVAYGALRANARSRNMGFAEFVRSGHDPTSVSEFAEDAAAVTGCGIAGIALLAAHYTGDISYDAFGSIAVGGLLGLTATYLINSNRLLLLGRSLGDEKMKRITDAIRSDPVVTEVYRAKSEELGPGSYRFVAEIEFSGAKVVERYLQRGDGAKRRQLHAMFKMAAAEKEDDRVDRMDAALAWYGEEVVTAVGDEVDRMEKTIVRVEPTIHYVDLETN